MSARAKINPCQFGRLPGVGKMIRSSRKLPGGVMIVECELPFSASKATPGVTSLPSTETTPLLASGCGS